VLSTFWENGFGCRRATVRIDEQWPWDYSPAGSTLQWGAGRSLLCLIPFVLLTRDIDIGILSVRHVLVLYRNGRNTSKQFLHCTVAQSFLFYKYQTSSQNSDRVSPWGALNTGGYTKFVIFDQ